MHSLTITEADTNALRALKGIREALRTLGHEEATLHDAREVWDSFQAQGYALVGHGDPRSVAVATGQLEAAGMLAVMDFDAERYERRRAQKSGATPEQQFGNPPATIHELPQPPAANVHKAHTATSYETAMALLAMSGGNPLNACAQASTLARTTRDKDYFGKVILAMFDVFPWVERQVREQGLMP